jgi:hypothetical protein
MKRSLKRVLSFWAAVIMMLNIVMPTGAFADVSEASAEFKATLPTALPEGAISPASLLGPAVEYGVIAEEYEQTKHTETNFAVYKYSQPNSHSIEVIGSGDNNVPFRVAELVGNTKF